MFQHDEAQQSRRAVETRTAERLRQSLAASLNANVTSQIR
jgi:hypothetical protein